MIKESYSFRESGAIVNRLNLEAALRGKRSITGLQY